MKTGATNQRSARNYSSKLIREILRHFVTTALLHDYTIAGGEVKVKGKKPKKVIESFSILV